MFRWNYDLYDPCVLAVSAVGSIQKYGHNLTTVVGIEGGGTQRNHNTISRTISNSLSAAGIKHLGGATDRSCKTVFRNAVPHNAPISDDSGNQINSMIPDLVTLTKNISRDETPLGGADHLVEGWASLPF